ncbi:MAG TPA: Crp/Fnr family transcriptional regulator [Taishania sp.]|nr:Crp/Fnr family transcriptional regulator [Taishania sp.]
MEILINSGIFKRRLTLVRNEFIKADEKPDSHVYYIESGSVRFYTIDEGEERITRFGYQGNIVVFLDSFLTNRPSAYIMQANKKTELLVATKAAFEAFVNQTEETQKFYQSILENLIVQQMEREEDLLINSPKTRYMRVLKRSPQLFQEIPLRYIANYLRMTPETLSRLKKS